MLNLVSNPRRLRLPGLFLFLLFAPGSLLSCSEDPGPRDGNGNFVNPDTDGDANSDTDGDADENSDTDGDSESVDGNSDTDADTDTDADADTDGDRPASDGDEWEWDEQFFVQAISPARGPLAGGTPFQISGEGFSPQTQVLFDDRAVDVSVSQSQLVGLTPPADTAGPVTLRIINEDGETAEIPNGFTYSNGLSVQSLFPTRVPTTGGIEITLHGQGFTNEMGVSFDGQSARRIDVLSPTSARVITPPNTRGTADIRISIPDESLLLTDAITFYRPLRITRVTPAIGDITGNELITLHTEGVTATTSIEIGDQIASIESVDLATGQIQVRTPAATATGPVDVFVENADDAFRLRDGFTYDNASITPRLVDISPATAPLTGGSEHVVSGRGLDQPGISIFLGNVEATIVNANDRFATITAPAGSEGTADLVLLETGFEMARIDDALLYRSDLAITALTPNEGPSTGGTPLILTGQGFTNITQVSLGGLPAAFEVLDDETLELITPLSEPGLVDLRLHTDHATTTLADAYRFTADLQVWSMRPSRGAIAGNTLVTVQGRGFDGLISVDIGDQDAAQIRRLDPYTITFRTPPRASAGPQNVDITSFAQTKAAPYPFVYFNPMSSFGGASGSFVDGSVNITVVTNDGSPIPNAFVSLSTSPSTAYQGYTDANGQITLSGPDVLGPQTIIATAATFSTYMVRHVNAQNLTLVLNPVEADGGAAPATLPPIAQIYGNLTISGKNANPDGGNAINMAMVRTTRVSRTGGVTNPGPNSITEGEGPFSLLSRVGDLALVALCGVYEESTETFTPKFMAVKRYLFLSDGDSQEVDLDCDIPLNQSLSVKLVDPVWAPDGPIVNEITTFIDFGFEGFFRIPGAVQSLDNILTQQDLPALDGPLEDLSFAVTAGSYNGLGVPYTQTWIDDITDLTRLHSTLPLTAVPEILSPIEAQIANGEIRIGLKGTNPPDLFYLILRNNLGLPVWTMIVPGDETTIPLPTFPAFADLPAESRPTPYPDGLFYGVIYGIRIDDFSFHGYTNRDLVTNRWSAFSVATWQMRLAP